jgi:hypothetical protein
MMQVRFINSGLNTDEGIKEVELQALRIDGHERPYAIVSNPYQSGETVRAQFLNDNWVVDLD